MKHIFRTLGLAALMVVPSLASAQKVPMLGFGLSGGLSLPTGDFGNGADMGYVVGGQLWIRPTSMLGVRADVNYDSWKLKTTGFTAASVSLRSLSGAANLVLHPMKSGSMVAPYLLGGGGLFNTQASSGSQSSDSQTDAGIQVGGGIEFKLSGFTTFIEGKFVNVFGDNASTNWIPVTFGVRFQP